ncbi:hypothetical protein CR205_15995 [Alteribacter lacisalsi]|uniref:ILEI/PANDER domain-containing protein n=1 Tax=Alteribacter lacisalsi TaxID=2045244 RepID=A0A2W0H4C7_9BACI|nr:CotH kinase family protein [Alteribacter lacisalsi]PYZ95881.1 hypothetical protein CR205_15995 [Alteribacter lacisalsi]
MKRNKWLLFLLIMVPALFVTWSLAFVLSAGNIFNDDRLEQAVRDYLDQPHGEITADQLHGIEEISLRGYGIEDLSGMDRFTNLRELDLRDNDIEDISELFRLHGLEVLDLRDNRITDLGPIRNAEYLIDLNVRGNEIEDMTPIQNLTTIQHLNIRENRIGDLSPLENFSELRDLNARFNRIQSIEPLRHLNALRERLYLDGNPIDDYSPIAFYFEQIEETDLDRLPPILSHTGGFHNEPFELSIASPSGDGEYYYTLDGSDPDPYENSENTFKYEEPIAIEDRSDEPNVLSEIVTNPSDARNPWRAPQGNVFKGTNVRVAEMVNGEMQDTISNTYFVGENAAERYDLPVVSLSFESDQVFGDEKGIYRFPLYENSGRLWERPEPANVIRTGWNHQAAWHAAVKKSGIVYEEESSDIGDDAFTEASFTTEGGREVEIRSTGRSTIHDGEDRYIRVDGETLLEPTRGIGLVRLDENEEFVDADTFDTHDVVEESDRLAQAIQETPEGYTLLFATYNEITRRVTIPLEETLAELGLQEMEEEVEGVNGSVSMEYFTPEGELGFKQNVGIRIHGNASRSEPQKTLRLYSRGEYGESNFVYPFFDGYDQTVFNRLLLRNSGNEWGKTMLLDGFAQGLISHSDLDTQAYQPTVVFLNGEYWGIQNLRERLDHHYLETVYDLDREDSVILENNSDIYHGHKDDSEHFDNMMAFVEENDMNDPEMYEQVHTMMDVENFIEYNVAQIYYANVDWPHNNLRMWRKNTEEYEPDAPYGHDGRWRWLVFDLDAFGGTGAALAEDTGERNPAHNTLNRATHPDLWEGERAWATLLFRSLLESDEFRNDFINRMADELNSSFEEERAQEHLASTATAIEPEIEEHLHRWSYPDSKEAWEEMVGYIEDYVLARPEYQREHVTEHFDLSGTSDISVNYESDKGTVHINTLAIDESVPGIGDPDDWTGTYFNDVPLTVRAEPAEGYRFTGWGEAVDSDRDTVEIVLDGDLTLTPQFEKERFSSLN